MCHPAPWGPWAACGRATEVVALDGTGWGERPPGAAQREWGSPGAPGRSSFIQSANVSCVPPRLALPKDDAHLLGPQPPSEAGAARGAPAAPSDVPQRLRSCLSETHVLACVFSWTLCPHEDTRGDGCDFLSLPAHDMRSTCPSCGAAPRNSCQILWISLPQSPRGPLTSGLGPAVASELAPRLSPASLPSFLCTSSLHRDIGQKLQADSGPSRLKILHQWFPHCPQSKASEALHHLPCRLCPANFSPFSRCRHNDPSGKLLWLLIGNALVSPHCPASTCSMTWVGASEDTAPTARLGFHLEGLRVLPFWPHSPILWKDSSESFSEQFLGESP